MSTPDIQYFGTSGTWSKPAGAVRVDYLVCGAGAGGSVGIGEIGRDGEAGALRGGRVSAYRHPPVRGGGTVKRLPRSHRRVLLVLLTGAPGLGGYTIGRTAMTGFGTVYRVLDRLERQGWAESDWESPEPLNRPRRRFYRLTREGRAQALAALGLKDQQEAAR